MVNSKGKLQGDTPPNRARIVWTIIHLSAAPNRLVGPPTVASSEITQFSVKISIFNYLTENLNSLTENSLSLPKIDNHNFL